MKISKSKSTNHIRLDIHITRSLACVQHFLQWVEVVQMAVSTKENLQNSKKKI